MQPPQPNISTIIQYLQKILSKSIPLCCETFLNIRVKKEHPSTILPGINKELESIQKTEQSLYGISDKELTQIKQIAFLMQNNAQCMEEASKGNFPSVITKLMEGDVFMAMYQRLLLTKLCVIKDLQSKYVELSLESEAAIYKDVFCFYKDVKLPEYYSYEMAITLSQFYFGLKSKSSKDITCLNSMMTIAITAIKQKKAELKMLDCDPMKLTDEQCKETLKLVQEELVNK